MRKAWAFIIFPLLPFLSLEASREKEAVRLVFSSIDSVFVSSFVDAVSEEEPLFDLGKARFLIEKHLEENLASQNKGITCGSSVEASKDRKKLFVSMWAKRFPLLSLKGKRTFQIGKGDKTYEG